MKNKILPIRIIITIVLGLLLYYFILPPINLTDPSFYTYICSIFIIYLITGIFKLVNISEIFTKGYKFEAKKKGVSILILLLVIILPVIINFILSPLFMSNKYANRIFVDETKSFTDNVSEVDFNALPLLDKDSSRKLGDRTMGELPELVSQFYVSDLYTQINYNNDIVRVTPLEYADIIKYFTNKKEGVKGYIAVNSVTGDSKLVKLDKGMKYMPSALFNEDLNRYLRFKYPTTVFGKESFEIDNDGNPYWVIPTIKYSGIGIREEINGVIILDPITGKTEKYKTGEIPSWIDQVYSANLIIEQFNDWGRYQEGFFNSIFGQKGVVQTTEGYNYTVMNDDVYLYTGVTSASTDESNLGFILTNLRTKETNFYAVPGAEEYSAMASALGQVQQMNYQASFPLLINLNGNPTYLISLKDYAGLVKMYAFVDVKDYQKVVTTDSSLGIEQAASNYINSANIDNKNVNLITKDITVSSVTTAIIDGTTYYYLIDGTNQKYKASIKTGENILPFVKDGTKIKISYTKEKDIIDIVKVG